MCVPGSWEAKAVPVGFMVLGLGGISAVLAAATHPGGGTGDYLSKLTAVATFTAGMAGAASAAATVHSVVPNLVIVGGVLVVFLVSLLLSRICRKKRVGIAAGTVGVAGAGTAASVSRASGAGSGALVVVLVGLLLFRIFRR